MKIQNVKMIPDGSGEFTRGMDMLVWKPEQNFGFRSWRYAMIVNDMEVEKMMIEKGKNQLGLDDDPYDITKPENLLKNISQNFNETDFAVTDLSHSKAIIEVEGEKTKEVLKKGCPFNFNTLEKNNSINSIYNGIAFTVDMMNDSPDKVRLFALRSFGESLYHSITDASLEFGFKSI